MTVDELNELNVCAFCATLHDAGGEEMFRTPVARAPGFLEAHFRQGLPEPCVVPLPTHVQRHQGKSCQVGWCLGELINKAVQPVQFHVLMILQYRLS